MSYCVRFALWICFALIVLESGAQQYSYIPFGLKEGLVQSQVRCITQDSRGYIWAGTLGGLSRFDGIHFINYDQDKGLPENQINCIIELHDGTIAAGSNGSIVLVNARAVTPVYLPEPLKDATINVLYEDAEHRIWIGTEKGMAQYDQGNMTMMTGALESAHIKAILPFQDAIWILSKEKFLKWQNGQVSTVFQPENSDINFFDLALDEQHHWWLANKGVGIIELNTDGSFIRDFSDDPTLATNTVTNILFDDERRMYCTSRFGFFKKEEDGFKWFNERNGLPTNDIRDILQDREGNIWLATYGYGLQRFTGEAFVSVTEKDGLTGNAVMSILQDARGEMWFSTFDKGICKSTGDSIVQYDLSGITQVNRIWSSLRDSNGNLWFASSDGLFRYDQKTFKQYTEADSLPSNMVLSLFEDQQHRLWVGTSKGTGLWANGTFKSFNTTGAPNKRVRCIREDRSGALWFATSDGVYRYQYEQFTRYTDEQGLPDNSTNCIEIDEYNHVWVGTQNGLALLEGEKFVVVELAKMIGSDAVNFLKYHEGQMWVGTNRGIQRAMIDSQTHTQAVLFQKFGLEEGLRSLETNLNAVFVDANGRIWFGTTDGVTFIQPNYLKLFERHVAPSLSFSKIQINLQDQDWSKISNDIDPITGLVNQLQLNYRQNHLTFYFNGITGRYANAVQYQYMLEGLDEDWKPLTEVPFATYSNLPYREFTFVVKALSHDGIWSEPIRYSFTVRPPFWLTWWFILIEILLVVGIVGIILYNRNRAIKAKREKEWFEMRSKMLALEQQSLNSSMNRHFIFNALNSIQYYINRQDRLAANRYLSDFAKLIRKNLDSSQDNLTTLRDEIERLELYLKLENMRFKDKFEYQINIDSRLNLDMIKVPAMLVQPFLENSIWHGLLPKESQGLVKVDVSLVDGHVEFIITDNGIGIDNSLKNKTQSDNHISKGMEITQNRIDLIKKTTGKTVELRGPYQISPENGPESGTRVEIIIPENFNELFPE